MDLPSLKQRAEKFGLTVYRLQQLEAVVEAIGREEAKKRLDNGESLTALYKEFVLGADTIPPWLEAALRLRGSILAAQKRGEWTEEDQELAVKVALWIFEQAKQD